ncbi:hypothetical protein DFP72DRAFT_853107 [Ephemerocybe angulata]|uniref:Uncharacterized protein n=1 Tax=Ephemerocybe angulata TaxID=980116 RepID=A0A8H6M299_9AGAR|nr:hypothetical protein DFP72DRAFT_853107 [Tulosesus angulatus]
MRKLLAGHRIHVQTQAQRLEKIPGIMRMRNARDTPPHAPFWGLITKSGNAAHPTPASDRRSRWHRGAIPITVQTRIQGEPTDVRHESGKACAGGTQLGCDGGSGIRAGHLLGLMPSRSGGSWASESIQWSVVQVEGSADNQTAREYPTSAETAKIEGGFMQRPRLRNEGAMGSRCYGAFHRHNQKPRRWCWPPRRSDIMATRLMSTIEEIRYQKLCHDSIEDQVEGYAAQ